MNPSNSEKLRNVCSWLSLINWIFFGLGVIASLLALANGSLGGILIFGGAAFGLLFTMLCIQIGHVLADLHGHFAHQEKMVAPTTLKAGERTSGQEPDVPDEWLAAVTKPNPPQES